MGCAPSSSSWGGAAGKGVDLDQTCVEVEELSARVAAARMRGARPRQEDVFVVRRGIQAAGNQCWLAVAVFDGHSGASSSNFAACHLWAEVGKQVEWARGDIKGALEQGFLATDKAMLNMGLRDGTTALVALASKEEVWVANCGDCRAVWCTRSGSTIALSTDHKPNMPSETVRIERAGGAVEYTPGRCPRVIAPGYSNLAMATSRRSVLCR
jgi:protein phosphatase 1B